MRVERLQVGTLLQIAEALEAVVGRCFGPTGGQVLFTRDTGEVLITRDGWKILTSLKLDHPVARVLVSCVSTHCEATGDGAKSFLLLLAGLLRGIQAARLRGLELRRAAVALRSFQTQVLDGVIRESLALFAAPLLPCGDPIGLLGALTRAYFRGKVARTHCGFLSEMVCEFYQRWRCVGEAEGAALISCHFAQLHTAVPGLPVGRSRVLEGLVFHRDFAVRCPMDGPLRAVAVGVALDNSLAPPGVTVSLASQAQFQSHCRWLANQVERGMASLQKLEVKLLMSSVKQSDLVLDHAQRAGISVVECMDEDELALFCRFGGADLFTNPGDWSQIGEEHIATVTFCQPAVLGPDRCAHVGFPERRGLVPHCLVLCGPVPGLADQCVCAFRGVVRMLQRAFEPIQSHHRHSGEAKERATCNELKRPNQQADEQLGSIASNIRNSAHINTEYSATEGLHTLSTTDGGQTPCSGQSQPLNTEMVPKHELTSQTRNGKATEMQLELHSGEETQKTGVLLVEGVALNSHTKESSSASSHVLIEAGSLLPVGGAFEFLLHHHLLQHATHTSCPDTQAACKLVAGAVLSVPRRLYPGRRFLEARSSFLRTFPPRPAVEGAHGFESMACKYQLLVSVLQCLGSLLSVDIILHTSMSSQRARRREQGEEEEGEEQAEEEGGQEEREEEGGVG